MRIDGVIENGEVNSAKKWERSLSLRITVLLAVATILLIGQSLYNLSSIDDVDDSIDIVNKAAFNLDDLSRNIKTPLADIRILSMEMVSAPNRQSLDEAKKRFDNSVKRLEVKIGEWEKSFEISQYANKIEAIAFADIVMSWQKYKEALGKTYHYINKGVRVAAFISVTGQEKTSYYRLQNSLSVFSQMLVRHSKSVYVSAKNQSSFAYYSLIATSIIQVLILAVTLYFVYRMFRTYMLASQVYEKKIEAKENQLSMALSNMSDGLYTVDKDLKYTMFNKRFTQMIGLEEGTFQVGGSLKDTLWVAAKNGNLGEGDPETMIQMRIDAIQSDEFVEWDSNNPQGRFFSSRKSAMENGGAIVIVSDVTERRNAEKELNDAFHKISSSIQYASKIQQSILPHKDSLNDTFEDHFVLWEPRDVVGGDVYWLYEWGDGVLMCLGDCTGHGVPGAFMTLISTGALERAINDVEIGNISSLVKTMNGLIRRSLGQDSGVGFADDGLELGVCYIEKEKKSLNFVGAKFDLLIVDNGEVTTIKGGNKGLGYREISSDYEYDTVSLNISPSAQFYMTTDGAVDQVSEKTKRRLSKKGFNELLLNVQNMPMQQQANILHNAIMEHQGNALRRDDMAIIGFKVG